MPRGRQAVKAIVSLVGAQDTTVSPHRAGTDGAAVGVRVGGALIYINDLDTAGSFHEAWRSAARLANPLPMRADPAGARPMWGVVEPAVMMSAADMPPAHARLEQTPGRPPCIWVTHGRMVFAVHDHDALRSTLAAFAQAERLAKSVFLPEPELNVRYRAEETVRRLLDAPAQGPRHRAGRGVAGPSVGNAQRVTAAAAPRSSSMHPSPRTTR